MTLLTNGDSGPDGAGLEQGSSVHQWFQPGSILARWTTANALSAGTTVEARSQPGNTD